VTSCPSRETLGRLGIEIADGAQFEELERHIEICSACQSALETLAHGGTGWGESIVPIVPDRADLPEIPGFVIEQELGRGSMGVVYRAWQPRMARRVAVKVISGGPVNAARVRDCWLREAHSAARVRDPRVVQIHDVGEANGFLYLVLEYVPGGSLKDRLDGPLSPAASAALAEKIGGGVAAVHRAGLLHLDLKPSNILLDSEPRTPWQATALKVADFGIARDADDSGLTRTTMRGPWGTPSYMAPEQVEPDRLAIGPASDVYAVGAILYELLTGRPPFRAASLAETMDQIRHRDPAPPRRLNPGIPQDLETICTTCLRKDPKRRYSSMDALSDDIRRWREGRPISARPVSVLERAWLGARRRPLTAALGAALGTTLLLGVLCLLVLWRRAETERLRAEILHDVSRANYEVASQSLNEICEITYHSMVDPKNSPYSPHVQAMLEQSRARQIELSRKNALEPSGQEQLATVDMLLAWVYRGQRRREDLARPLLEESIALWESCIAQGADPDKARARQRLALGQLEEVMDAVPSEADIRRWETTSALIFRRFCGNRDDTGQLFGLSHSERILADHLAVRGRADWARRLLEGKLRLYEALLESHHDSPDLILARALTLAALGKADEPAIAIRLGRPGEAAPGSPWHTMLVLAVAELTVRTYGLQACSWVSRDRQRTEPDDTAWAEQVVGFVSKQTSELGLGPASVPAVAWQIRTMIFRTAAHQRYVGDHEAARRTARRYGALAAQFVRTCPGDAEPYLLVSGAYLQDAKNASRAGDHAAVFWSLRQSLEAAVTAAIVDPTSEEARRSVVDRRGRLARHESERK
jgi:eukaryotic-like serine/threonine-protein kinase